MTDEQRKRVHVIMHITDDRVELAERIVALEDERNKLRELLAKREYDIERLREIVSQSQTDLEAEFDCAEQMEDKEEIYKSENAKLRKLCADMFEAVKCCCGEWCTKTVSNCDNNKCGWHKCYVALRELGIEMTENE